MKTNWIKKLIGGLSLTSTMFIFQACYGTPQDFGMDVLIEGQVKSKTSGLPIRGIKVAVSEQIQYELTDEDGRFSFYTTLADTITLSFQDTTSIQNGLFLSKDTVLTKLNERTYLNITLEDK